MMYLFLLILSYTTLSDCLMKSRLVNLPTNCRDETPIDKEHVECPFRRNELRVDHLQRRELTKLCRPKGQEDDHIEGYVCKVQTWRTTCLETWYFTTYVKYDVVEETPTPSDCFKELERIRHGVPAVPYFAPSVCYWNAENTIRVTLTTLTPHNVIEDPYNLKLLDPSFPGGICNGTRSGFCYMKNERSLWIPSSSSHSKHCQWKGWECVTAHILNSWDESRVNQDVLVDSTVIEAPEIGRIGIYDACQMTFCNVTGIKLATGEWWVPHDYDDKFRKSFDRLRHCSSDEKIGVRNHVDKTLFEELDIKAELEHQRCIDALMKLRNGESLNALEMSYFAPTTPGLGYAYRFVQQKKVYSYCIGYADSYDYRICKKYYTQKKGRAYGGYYNFTKTILGTIVRGLCDYKTVQIPMQIAGIRESRMSRSSLWRLPLTNETMEIHLKNYSWSLLENEQTNSIYNLSWNGFIQKGGDYIINAFSLYDGLLRDIQVAKLEVMSVEHPHVIEDHELVDPIIKHISDNSKLDRTDVVDEIEKKGKGILLTIKGWFSGLSQIVRWGLWIIGGLITVYSMYKINKLIKEKGKKRSEDNFHSGLEALTNQNMSGPYERPFFS
ncbi:glycoprotein [Yata virus]|uniref:Glycoprotein n=1 Tax=Yata virus TaxID=1272960 RepID=A0A096ZGU1_9RHAB|nr:glycoprotein [Yata virus]AIR95572.1 glycoprotein [Yata virus]